MSLPLKLLALRFFEQMEEENPTPIRGLGLPLRSPLGPSFRHNQSPTKAKKNDEDLDDLAKQLEITPVSPTRSKTAALASRFEQPLATVLSFRLSPSLASASVDEATSPRRKLANEFKSNANTKLLPSRAKVTENPPSPPRPKKKDPFADEQPDWANKNYKDILLRSPRKLASPRKESLQFNTPSHVADPSTSPRQSPNRNAPKMAPPAENTHLSPLKAPLAASVRTPHSSVPLSPIRPSRQMLPVRDKGDGLPAYEYLCRIQALKNWLETILQIEIPQLAAELINYVRNGIYLAKLANVVLPLKRTVFTNDSKLEFRHTENINRFFQLLDYMNVPDLFRFELTDLYDAKNVPKVWFCLHALTYMLNKMNPGYPKAENLVGTLDFSALDIRVAARALVGSPLPNFASADSDSDDEDEDFVAPPLPPVVGASPREALVMYSDREPEVVYVERQPEVVYVEKEPRVVYIDSPQRVMVSLGIQTEPVRGSLSRCDVGTSTMLPPLPPLPPLETVITEHEADLTVVRTNSPLTDAKDFRDANDYELDRLKGEITKLQALARGANFRYRMFVDKIMLKLYSEEIEEFQALARGALARTHTVHRHRKALVPYSNLVTAFQLVLRRRLVEQRMAQPLLTLAVPQITQLQAMIRGGIVRKSINDLKFRLQKSRHSIIGLQLAVRQREVASKYRVYVSNLRWLFPLMTRFQAAARGHLVRRKPTATPANMPRQSVMQVTRLQLVIRGEATRYWMDRVRHKVRRHTHAISEFQAIARGGISRTRMCDNVLVGLLYEDHTLNRLFAKVRGNAMRREVRLLKRELRHVEETSILPIQSIFRGIYVRTQRYFLHEDIYEQIGELIELQGAMRGKLVRDQIDDMNRYYVHNIATVVKAQLIMKTWMTKRAFDLLLLTKNPPLLVIRRFAYLLMDDLDDFTEEMELSEIKDRIVDISKHNEQLELQLELLDIKLQMLEENKITVDEFVTNKVKPRVRPMLITQNLGLPKLVREKLEFFATLLYLLQTHPAYFVRLYAHMDIAAKDKPDLVDLFHCVVALFPIKEAKINVHGREEYFFVKFIVGLMEHDIKHHCGNITDITRPSNCWWIDYFVHLNCHTYQRLHLKLIMGPVMSEVVDGEHLDFELDPARIYADLLQHECKVMGRLDKPLGLSAAAAIKQPEVLERFVNNLMQLREVATLTLSQVQKVLNQIPLHVRLVCKRVYEASQLQFPDKLAQHHLAVTGVVFAKHYLTHIFNGPENFGYLMGDPFLPGTLVNPRASNNLRQLARIVIQLFLLKPFSDNFLKPLNDFVVNTHDSVKMIIREVINVGEIEAEYNLSDYDDIITTSRPQLLISVTAMVSLEKVCSQNLDVMAPLLDDQLYQVMHKQQQVVGLADDYMALTEMGVITLDLMPATKEDTWADSKALLLFTMSKRCLLYIMRVQLGDNLLELLVLPISDESESRFSELIQDDSKLPYHKTLLGNLKTLTLHELKKKTLENLIKLENLGLITRQNSFQEILNRIATDIKTKDTQRQNRKMQLAIAVKTVSKLAEKERNLKRQLADYNRDVDAILVHFQKQPKDRKIFNLIPVLSKQYFYHRELRKRNRLPKFGSYKYLAKKLMDQHILKDYKNMSGHSKVDFMFSCHAVGRFTVEAATGLVTIPGALQIVTLDELLNLQYEHEEELKLFDGMATFKLENLIAMIFRKFYDTNRE